MNKIVTILILLLSSSVLLKAQMPLKTGAQIGNIQLVNVDDRVYSLDDQKAVKGFVLVFMSVSCESCMAYKPRIISLDQKYKVKGFPVIGIAPHGDDPISYPLDAMPEMKKWHRSNGIRFPYLADTKFKYTESFGINYTPTVVILQKLKNSRYLIKYIGQIDDNPELSKDKTNKFAEHILNKMLLQK